MSSIDPRLASSFVEWSDYMNPTLEAYGTIGRAFSDDDWKSWAAGLLSLTGIAEIGAPSPYQFDDWREWAFRFTDLLNQGS